MALYEKNTGAWEILETTANQWNMSIKSYMVIFFIALAVQVAFIKFGIMDNNHLGWRGELYSTFFNQWFSDLITPGATIDKDVSGKIWGEMIGNSIKYFIYTSPLLIFVMWYILAWAKIKSKEKFGSTEYISGTKIVEEQEQIKATKKVEHNFKLGKIPLPITSEASHVTIVGASGAGKTQFIQPTIRHALRCGFKCLVNDEKGDWIASNYNESVGDLIFNPVDRRSIKWTIWNDIQDIIDIENFATWIIPDNPQSNDPFWNTSARVILKAILFYLFEKNSKEGTELTNSLIKKYVQMESFLLSKTLQEAGFTEAADYVKKQDSLSTFRSYMGWVYYAQDGNFSVKDWLKPTNNSSIFVANQDKTKELLKPVLTLFINVVAAEILSMPDNEDRKIYLFLDEFTSLSKLEKIVALLKLGRSKQCSIWLAYQDYQQLEKIYSKADMDTFINNTSNIAVMLINEPNAAEYFSKRLGKQVFTERNKSISTGVNANRDGTSWQEQRKEELVVKSGDIQNLKPLYAYVKIVNIDGLSLTSVNYAKPVKIANEFEKIEMTIEEQMNLVKYSSGVVAAGAVELEEEKEEEIITNKDEDSEFEESRNSNGNFF